MTEERLREIEKTRCTQTYIVPDDVRELIAEIRRLQAEVERLRPVYEKAKDYMGLCDDEAWIKRDDPSCADEWEPFYDRLRESVLAVDAAKAKEE